MTMPQIVDSISALRNTLTPWRGRRIAFVPTMGNLHSGHLALVRHAYTLADRVVVSIFVNPLQFGPTEDYGAYPRTLDQDTLKLVEVGTDLVFAPSPREVYPQGREGLTTVTVPGLSDLLCGAARPGHFSGVATVVTLLLNLVQPQTVLFGEKDFQQLLVIRRLVADLHLPVEVVAYPTVREPDGLAMSSRNGYLSVEERKQAPILYRTLCKVCDSLVAGVDDYGGLEDACRMELTAAGLLPDYCAVRRALDLAVPNAEDRHLVVLAAARLGRTRLIDNIQVIR
ncbi:pantothenate synthetase [Gammaproteobacteria bacterium]